MRRFDGEQNKFYMATNSFVAFLPPFVEEMWHVGCTATQWQQWLHLKEFLAALIVSFQKQKHEIRLHVYHHISFRSFFF